MELNQRQPSVLSWTVDFAALGLAAGSNALLLALASATSGIAGATDNTLTAADRAVRTLIEGTGPAGETKAVARLVRLDAVAVIP